MRRKNLVVLVLACVLSLVLAFSASAQVSDDYTGWNYTDDGNMVYYIDGVMVRNDWVVLEEEGTFYFGADGVMYAEGVYTIDSDLYGFDISGQMYDDAYFEIYDYTTEPATCKRYCAKAGGALYVNEWATPSYLYNEGNDNENNYSFYASADGQLLEGLQKVGDKYYYFHEDYYASRVEDQIFYIYNEAIDWHSAYYAREDGSLAHNQWVYHEEYDDSYWSYYDENCQRIIEDVVSIGGQLYAFDNSGRLFYDGICSIYNPETNDWDYYCATATKDGGLYVNEWVQLHIDESNAAWYYCGADGKLYSDGIYKIGGKYYYFFSDGSMAENTTFEIGYYDEDLDAYITVGNYRAKANGELYMNSWYLDEETWYYYGADGKAPHGLATIGGQQYCFNEWGVMIEDDVISIFNEDGYKHYIVDENGTPVEAKNNDWTKAFDKWYLVLNDEFCRNEICLVGDKYYAFKWDGSMYENEMFELDSYDEETDTWLGWKTYYAKADGTLARNEVMFANRYGYGSEDLYMFGADCATIDYYTGLYELDGKTYYVFGDGNVLFDCFSDTEDGVYRFDKNGVGKKLADGWYYDDTAEDYPEYWHWIYVQDGVMLIDGLYEIDGKRYAFDDSYGLITNDIYYDWQTDKYWLLTYMDEKGRGGSVCEETNVWKTINGEYVYLTEDASLHIGWMDRYYLDPYMSYCEYIVDEDGYIYTVNHYGVSKKLTTTGLFAVNGTNAYLRNGKAVTNEWIKLSDGWRYFDEGGCMLVDETRKIDNVWYCFDHNGRMCDNGWHRGASGSWYWAAKSGALFTGIDSVGYVFSEDGRLVEDDVILIDDVFYVVNRHGKKIATFTNEGWNEAAGNWYYVTTYDYYDGVKKEVLRGGYYDEFGRFFVFDQQGRMLSNRFYDNNEYYLGSNGNALKNWFMVDGYWYFGNDDDYGRLYKDGIYFIGEKEFAFDEDGRLHVNKTFFYWNEDLIVTTNGNGEVISRTDATGWQYSEDASWGYGQAHYYKDGKPYTGWLGSYYIDYGTMAINAVVMDEKTDKRYCIDKKGQMVTSKWYEIWEDDWVLARADGTLYYNEWVKTGGKWYYFEDVSMVYDCVIAINGTKHVFDENGVWISEYTDKKDPDFSGKSDGWIEYNGKWYFSMAGEAVYSDTLFVDGKWYAFDRDGVMVSNAFYFDYYGGSFGVHYYTSGGARGEYTGWQYIGKDWVYFNKANLACEGWILDDGKYYYQEFVSKDTGYTMELVGARMVTGYQVIDRTLYYFENSGILTKTITTPGWYKGGSDWYYIDANGNVVCGETEYKIGGSRYAFDYDGKMVANEVWGDYYYNANGELVTKSGWYAIGNQWVYVLSNGKIAYEGVFRIGGKDYYFFDGYWIG